VRSGCFNGILEPLLTLVIFDFMLNSKLNILFKLTFLSFVFLLHGCAKYKGWEDVKIIESAVGKSCIFLGGEICENKSCETWLKKRATIIKANTLVLDIYSNFTNGKRYQCRTGLPPYNRIEFSKKGYEEGSNIVTGEAFLTQRDGGVITCAGERVTIHPDTEYFLAKNDLTKDIEPSLEASEFEKHTVCDSLGKFEFNNVQNGRWIIETNVSWDVFNTVYVPPVQTYVRTSINNLTLITLIGPRYHTKNYSQGGDMYRVVEIKNGKKNRFIITRTTIN